LHARTGLSAAVIGRSSGDDSFRIPEFWAGTGCNITELPQRWRWLPSSENTELTVSVSVRYRGPGGRPSPENHPHADQRRASAQFWFRGVEQFESRCYCAQSLPGPIFFVSKSQSV